MCHIKRLFGVLFLALVFQPAGKAQGPGSQVVIRFFDQVNERSVTQLFRLIDQEVQRGTKRVVLLIASPGGTVFHGLAAYNYLKGLPNEIEVVTHNFGSADSIAVMIFCAGSIRRSVPNARFLLHGIGIAVASQTRLEEKALLERLNSMQTDSENIARVIATTTKKSLEDVKQAIFDGTVLNAEQAKQWGLVTEIQIQLFEPGSRILSIEPPIARGIPANAESPPGVARAHIDSQLEILSSTF